MRSFIRNWIFRFQSRSELFSDNLIKKLEITIENNSKRNEYQNITFDDKSREFYFQILFETFIPSVNPFESKIHLLHYLKLLLEGIFHYGKKNNSRVHEQQFTNSTGIPVRTASYELVIETVSNIVRDRSSKRIGII